MKGLRNLVQLISIVITGIAVYQELQKPESERTWQGKVLDFFPYDFRMPTWERAKERLWNPENSEIVVPTIFGVGWTLNFAQVYKMGEYFYAGAKNEA